MLTRYITDPMNLALAQAAATAAIALIVVIIARNSRIRIEREVSVALLRGFVQVVAIGSVLLLVFRGPWAVGLPILALMILAAAVTSAKRARGLPDAFRISFAAIGMGAGVLTLLMTSLGAIDPRLPSLIPIGSMLIANSMNTNSLTLDRLKAEILSHAGEIEAALCLGAHPYDCVAPHVCDAIMAGLIPRLDTLRSLGVIWIPGVMTGMILGGENPVRAAIYQFVIIGMIFSSSALTSISAALLARARLFTAAQQLVLRPGKS